jgi:hypothetical protein
VAKDHHRLAIKPESEGILELSLERFRLGLALADELELADELTEFGRLRRPQAAPDFAPRSRVQPSSFLLPCLALGRVQAQGQGGDEILAQA